MLHPRRSLGLVAALAALTATTALASKVDTQFVAMKKGALTLRVQVATPEAGEIKGDILFLHGFADRADNHGPLFDEWTAQGFRVIAFDLPSHGESTGDLDHESFEDLARLTARVEQITRETPTRPLILSGWSTGGLLAARILQSPSLALLGRPVSGAILFSPGIAVRPVVGTFGVVTQSTLTRNPNPPHEGPIKPLSPFLKPVFASRLLLNALLSQHELLPRGVPTLVLLGGEHEDRYVETDKIEEWVTRQKDAGSDIAAVELPGGFHELDNEPGQSGASVRAAAGRFASLVIAGGNAGQFTLPSPCELLLLP